VDELVHTSGASLPDPLFSPLEIESILKINYQMLYKHIHAWNDVRPESWMYSLDTVFWRRAIRY
jgi:hypothetical protein